MSEVSYFNALAASVGVLMRDNVRQGIASAKGKVLSKDTEVAGDLVTDTDFTIQDTLEKGLAELLPSAGFLGEEGFEGTDALADQPHWIVDPLDGTLNFACDLPFFGSSVALLVNGIPMIGVVYDYGSDAIYEAVKGQGARLNGDVLSWDADLAARSPVGISSGFLARMTNPDTSSMHSPNWLGSRYRIFGSQAIQLCWAAAGRLRLNINCEAKLWDDAAGALICTEAGADYAALDSDPLFPLGKGSPALEGKSLFSVSGSPALVSNARRDFLKG